MHNEALIPYLLLLGDSALVQGQRLCEWCGHAPAIEEELALMNVGLDLVGQARNWLEYAAELLDDGRDADAWPSAETSAPTATCCWSSNPTVISP